MFPGDEVVEHDQKESSHVAHPVLTVSSQDRSRKSSNTDVKDTRSQRLILGQNRLDFTCKFIMCLEFSIRATLPESW